MIRYSMARFQQFVKGWWFMVALLSLVFAFIESVPFALMYFVLGGMVGLVLQLIVVVYHVTRKW